MSYKRSLFIALFLGAIAPALHAQEANSVELHRHQAEEPSSRGVFFAGGGAGGGPNNSQFVFTMGGFSLDHAHLGPLIETGAVHFKNDPGMHGFVSFNVIAGWQTFRRRKDVVFTTAGLTASGGRVGFVNFGAGYDLHIARTESAIRFEVRDYTSGPTHSPTFRILWLMHDVDPIRSQR